MENCIFCKIVAGEIPSAKVYEDEEMVIFKDVAPKDSSPSISSSVLFF